MPENLILLAVPGFFALMGAEMVASRVLRRGFYATSDTVNDLALGVLDQLATLFYSALVVGTYAWIHAHARIGNVRHTALGWVLAFVAWDFAYYWAHRAMHEVNLLWATHAPHHQSEEYNLAVALRQGPLQAPLTCYFYWPLAVLGIDTAMFVSVAGLNLIYQFWIHTRFVRTLGPLELVMNTPSHHRVHHGKNPAYLDRNHGGVFIVWDRMFGTFAPEIETPVYGTVDPLASWNPVWAMVKNFVVLARASRNARDFSTAVRIWFARPDWNPDGAVTIPDPVVPAARTRTVSRGRLRYALAQFVVLVTLALALLVFAPRVAVAWRVLVAVQVVAGLASVGGVLDARAWARWLEPVRLVALGATAVAWWVA